jgi:dimethylhistidine N-methyltransferase
MKLHVKKVNYCQEFQCKFVEEFADDVDKGLSSQEKYLQCKYIYDDYGSELFKKIMTLPEYYLTRCEIEILEKEKDRLANIFRDDPFNLIELGAGDGKKTKILLKHFMIRKLNFCYTPIDISESAVEELIDSLTIHIEGLKASGLITEYFYGLKHLSAMDNKRKVVLFLGSNIGNMNPSEAKIFLIKLWSSLNHDDFILIGFDLKKNIKKLIRAYNDDYGITAEFNKNLLYRINKELGGKFDTDKFEYFSTYDAQTGAIKSFLISTEEQKVYIDAIKKHIYFNKHEAIHTESSYKYDKEDIKNLAKNNGFKIEKNYFDKKKYFANSLWRVVKCNHK